MATGQEQLVRKAFEAERDYHYRLFRQEKWELAEIVATLPDPAEREEVLRGYWNLRGEELYSQYRESVSGVSIAELKAEIQKWEDAKAAIDGERGYQQMMTEAVGRAVANDNEKDMER